MRGVIGVLLLSVFVVAPWASAQTSRSVSPSSAKGRELTSSTAKAGQGGQMAKKRMVRRAARKKPVAVKSVKKVQARRSSAKQSSAPAKSPA